MSFYDELASDADSLITEFGSAATLKRTTTGAYDPATGSAAITTTSQSVVAVAFAYPQKFIDHELIRVGDLQVYLSAVDVSVPVAGDVLTWQAVDYKVISVRPLAPNGTNVLHELQIRGVS